METTIEKPIIEERTIVCLDCKGSGKINIFSKVIADLGGNGNTEIECLTCDGKGKITLELERKIQDQVAKYCQCDKSSRNAKYHLPTEEHEEYWTCRDCGKIIEYDF